MKKEKQKKGFTLIELLVVIAIIAVLMGILMPALRAAKDHASRIQCTGNVRSLSLAWTMYAGDNDNRIVNAMAEPIGNGGRTLPWVVTVDQNRSVEEKQEAMKKGAFWTYLKNVKVYRCPSDRRIKIGTPSARSYSVPDGANGEEWPPGQFKASKTLTDIQRPSEKYIFVEDIDTRGSNQGSWALNVNNTGFIDPLAVWHKDRSGMGFADGHSEMHSWKDQTFLDWSESAIDACLLGTSFNFSFDARIENSEDYRFLVENFPCKTRL